VLGTLGAGVVIEEGVLVLSATRAMLKGDTRGELRVETDAWIGRTPTCTARAASASAPGPAWARG
jgi:hypothetical protein